MADFTLDPVLVRETRFIGDLSLCRLLRYHDKTHPWLVLVPRLPDAVEIMDLPEEAQKSLMRDIVAASALLRRVAQPDKINVGALGNIVRQMHVHVMGRYQSDPVWPRPLWGTTTDIFSDAEWPAEIARWQAAL
ncbi:MAG TPA: HIT family protein [Dongiaceae bacterium]|jgi:diadenosine tetraphosphate (Ap4A) HIT family hydrolase|nr:HIT family protein [Dongiaceae bacterium]